MVRAVIGVLRGRDDGAVAILVALFAVVLFGFAALVVDVGHASDVRGQNQHAADAAALAAAQSLAAANGAMSPDDVAAVVEQYVSENSRVSSSDWSTCTDGGALATLADTADPGDSCISYAESTQADGSTGFDVRVQLPPQQVATTFGGIFGVSHITVSPIAEAHAGVQPPSPCQPCDPRLGADGQPVSAPALPGGLTVPDTAGSPIGVVDPATGCPTAPGGYTRTVTSQAGLPDPSTIAVTDCVLAPGLYVFDDVTLKVAHSLSNDTSSGHGVTLVFRGGGRLDMAGSLHLAATPSSMSAAQQEIPGIVLIQDGGSPFELGPGFTVTGSVYALGSASWLTDAGNCPASGGCRLDQGVLAVANTDFDGRRNDDVPNVASDTPVPPPPPQPAHLVR